LRLEDIKQFAQCNVIPAHVFEDTDLEEEMDREG
jgi:hypothetical protein